MYSFIDKLTDKVFYYNMPYRIIIVTTHPDQRCSHIPCALAGAALPGRNENKLRRYKHGLGSRPDVDGRKSGVLELALGHGLAVHRAGLGVLALNGVVLSCSHSATIEVENGVTMVRRGADA
jgi:hypothetical protein